MVLADRFIQPINVRNVLTLLFLPTLMIVIAGWRSHNKGILPLSLSVCIFHYIHKEWDRVASAHTSVSDFVCLSSLRKCSPTGLLSETIRLKTGALALSHLHPIPKFLLLLRTHTLASLLSLTTRTLNHDVQLEWRFYMAKNNTLFDSFILSKDPISE